MGFLFLFILQYTIMVSKAQKKALKAITKGVGYLPGQLHAPKKKSKANKSVITVKGKGMGQRIIRGRGSYWTDFKDYAFGRGEGQKTSRFNDAVSAGAGALGNYLAPGMGGAASKAASYISKWLGAGTYVKKNSLVGIGYNPVAPPSNSVIGSTGCATFRSSGNFRVKHREFITNINANNGAAFTNISYFLNPGNPILCPWLAQIANNFEEYEWHGLIMEYRTTSGNIVSTSPGMGLIIMATDYDVIDNAYANKQQMEIADFCGTGPCYTNIDHPIECDPRQNVQKKMFVQPGVTVASQSPDDPRFSSLGNFQIAVTGVPGTSSIGELWITYDIELSKPQINAVTQAGAGGYAHLSYHVALNGTAAVAAPVLTQTGTSWSIGGGATGTQLICSVPGIYQVTQSTKSTANLVTTLGTTLLGAANYRYIDQSTTGVYGQPAVNAAIQTTNLVSYILVIITNPGDGIQMTMSNTTTVTSYSDIYISPYQSNLTIPKKKQWSLQDMLDRLSNLEVSTSTGLTGDEKLRLLEGKSNSKEEAMIEEYAPSSSKIPQLPRRISSIDKEMLIMQQNRDIETQCYHNRIRSPLYKEFDDYATASERRIKSLKLTTIESDSDESGEPDYKVVSESIVKDQELESKISKRSKSNK